MPTAAPALPLAELHLHLEGTLEPELIMALAERNGVTLPYADLDDLRSRYAFTDLQSFLDLYYANMAVLRTEQDFADLTNAYLARARVAGVRHVEAFFDVQAHTERGVPAEVALGGVSAALQESEASFGISSGLIVTFLRHLPGEHAVRAFEEVLATGVPVLGIGLCSTEIGNPAEKHREVFARARAEGLHVVAHAGEEGPAQNVWDVLEVLGAERVDHGVRCLEDDALVEHLAARRIPLTVCPFSNVRLRVVDTLADHPLVEMMERGLLVTVNSDDPAYFGGYVDDNVAGVVETLGLTRAQLRTLALNSVEASFVGPTRRHALVADVESWYAAG